MSIVSSTMQLYDRDACRLYLNDQELVRFLKVSRTRSPDVCQFALVLAYTGMRLSEARTLRFGAIQTSARIISVQTLKRRRDDVVREIPMPHPLHAALATPTQPLEDFIWARNNRPVPRSSAYRWIKDIMQEADIDGPQASPKGLRHGFGRRAIMAGVPLNILQRWMGHASMETTAIYATVLGPDQLKLSDQMWPE